MLTAYSNRSGEVRSGAELNPSESALQAALMGGEGRGGGEVSQEERPCRRRRLR